MPIDVVRKINPFLQRFMFNRALVPIIIESEKPFFQNLVEILSTLHFPFTQKIESFGFIATLARPEQIKALASEEDIIMIHYNMPKFALPKIPLTDINIPSPFPRGLSLNPFKGLSPIALPKFNLSKLQDTFKDKYNSTMTTRKLVGADLAETEGITGKGVKLATIDTGVDPTHPQISFNVQVKSTLAGQIADLNGHGTHCITTNSGKYARHRFNEIEVMGVAPEATRLSYKCLGFIIGAGTQADVIAAMEQAYKDGAEVMSMSLGSENSQGGAEIDPECRVIKGLSQMGVMIVVAAGNSGPDPNTINTPGISPSAITVGAINPRTSEIAKFSSRGPTIDNIVKPDVVAPGVDIYSGSTGMLDVIGDKIPDRYAVLSGTSMATPHIAGLCALLKQRYPQITSEDFKNIVMRNNKKSNDYGWGMPHWRMFDGLDR